MKTMILTGKDDGDLEAQIWTLWCDPAISIKKRHAIEKLDPNFMPAKGNPPPMTVQNTVSVKIDYEELCR